VYPYLSLSDSDIFVRVSAKKRIAVIPGDGIGKEVIPQAVRVLEAVAADVVFTHFDWGADRYLADKTTVPPDGFAMLARDSTRSSSEHSAIRACPQTFTQGNPSRHALQNGLVR